MYLLLTLFLLTAAPVQARASEKPVLLFVAPEQTYYSEYVVMRRALEAAGFQVEVRSVRADSVSVYMVPAGTSISETAGTMPGGSAAAFRTQFRNLFGADWRATDDPYPPFVRVDGRIQDLNNMDGYAALVIAGGLGALNYRVDGQYDPQGSGNRLLSPETVAAAAQKLQELALDALRRGKPVLAQCHGAGLPAYWRIPGTQGPGVEMAGISLIKGGIATGFPEPQTGPALQELGITYRADDPVVVTSPNGLFDGAAAGRSRVITTRDWYPQTVAFAAGTLIRMLETYEAVPAGARRVRVLVLHGGAVQENNCHPGNRQNDVPCNYGGGENLPADFRNVRALLEAVRPDSLKFTVADLNLTGAPGLPASPSAWLDLFSGYEVVFFYKHWSTGVTTALQEGLLEFVRTGGGAVAIHHGLYNDRDGLLNKDLLARDLFGVESAMATWSASVQPYQLIATGLGHFVSTYQVPYAPAVEPPSFWTQTPPPPGANTGAQRLPAIAITDELYLNNAFTGTLPSSGRGAVQPLFSTDAGPAGMSATAGFVRYVNHYPNLEGRAAYFQPGERKQQYAADSPYGQVLRNAVFWAAGGRRATRAVPEGRPDAIRLEPAYPNPFNPVTNIGFVLPAAGAARVRILDLQGRTVLTVADGRFPAGRTSLQVNAAGLSSGVYLVRLESAGRAWQQKITLLK